MIDETVAQRVLNEKISTPELQIIQGTVYRLKYYQAPFKELLDFRAAVGKGVNAGAYNPPTLSAGKRNEMKITSSIFHFTQNWANPSITRHLSPLSAEHERKESQYFPSLSKSIPTTLKTFLTLSEHSKRACRDLRIARALKATSWNSHPTPDLQNHVTSATCVLKKLRYAEHSLQS